ncbi:MAG: dihydroneopterin aldolase [Thaumarchaeota archaeon]|nr:dihydroneopterin aldolase [Nitrososphaerota archaeon]
MADRIFIDNLRVRCSVGATEKERLTPQDVLIDASLFLDLREAASSNDLEGNVNYKEELQRISGFVSKGRFVLLEGLAEGVASLCLSNPKVQRVRVRVRKGKYSGEPSIGVEVERTRER